MLLQSVRILSWPPSAAVDVTEMQAQINLILPRITASKQCYKVPLRIRVLHSVTFGQYDFMSLHKACIASPQEPHNQQYPQRMWLAERWLSETSQAVLLPAAPQTCWPHWRWALPLQALQHWCQSCAHCRPYLLQILHHHGDCFGICRDWCHIDLKQSDFGDEPFCGIHWYCWQQRECSAFSTPA